MSTPPPDGGPAFPRTWTHHFSDGMTEQRAHPGMSLRAYFAGQALVGVLSDARTYSAIKSVADATGVPVAKATAQFCLAHADSLLSALSASEPEENERKRDAD